MTDSENGAALAGDSSSMLDASPSNPPQQLLHGSADKKVQHCKGQHAASPGRHVTMLFALMFHWHTDLYGHYMHCACRV